MFLEELAVNILGMVIFLPIVAVLLNWFMEQLLDIMAMDSSDWAGVLIFLGIAIVYTIIA